MNIETLRQKCLTLPFTEEDVKWGNDLCFTIAKKMYCVTGLEGEFGCSLKVKPNEFEQLITKDGIRTAPYIGRYKWIFIDDPYAFSSEEWDHYIEQSYHLVRSKLPKSTRNKLS